MINFHVCSGAGRKSFVGAFLALFAVFSLSFSEGVAAETPELTEADKKIIEDAVKEKLVDPFSAKFKWMPYNGDKTYCGLVNAKNRMGGYTGFVPFTVLYMKTKERNIGALPQISTYDPKSTDSQVTVQLCEMAGYKDFYKAK
ncbi:hypothetical protein [Magnetofaba australis]|uniref:Uncharacterized protein n=1 Tax=Magnetofaba australis IT-1 TaxID=1434232 RepID=A0A1Y2K4P2_9PROT|nr:hypothetical protein [Magnetofaba australis]OSM04337.1 hypothetical protein MAIT1_04228 [Magnetofaba australis IT-1]